jgi:hypothetical protein
MVLVEHAHLAKIWMLPLFAVFYGRDDLWAYADHT